MTAELGNNNIQSQNLTIDGKLPNDRPNDRPFRVYVALTNHCNRACPWCSTYSSPAGSTFITLQQYKKSFPKGIQFEVQLEGGEPTIHPEFMEIMKYTNNMNQCTKIVIVTNGTVIPRGKKKLRKWLSSLGNKTTIKLSINHYLLTYDNKLFDLACDIKEMYLRGEIEGFVINVRLRKEEDEENEEIISEIKKRNLNDITNTFWLQKYGYGSSQENWEEPFIVSDQFSLINPDGSTSGINLIRRSNVMRDLP